MNFHPAVDVQIKYIGKGNITRQHCIVVLVDYKLNNIHFGK